MTPEEKKERAKAAYNRWYNGPKGVAYREARKRPRADPETITEDIPYPATAFDRTEPDTPDELAQPPIPEPSP